MRRLEWVVAVLIAAVACAVPATAAARRAVPMPQVQVTARTIDYHGRPALLIQSITVAHVKGVRLHVTCGGCRRYPTPIRETYPKPGVKRFSRVNWIVAAGRSIHVIVTSKGRLGRYLLLGAGRRGGRTGGVLVYKASGCLNARHRHAPCPRHGKRQPSGAAVPGGSPAPAEPGPYGTWQLFGSANGAPELGYIKTGGGVSSVEVHWETLNGGVYRPAGDYTSDFSPAEAHNGTFQLFGSANGAPELGFVKTGGGVSLVEVHWEVLSGGSYKSAGDYVSDFGSGEANNGIWRLFGGANGVPQLGFVKVLNSGSGTVEIHWDNLSGGSYKRAGDFASDFSPGVTNVVWQLLETGGAPLLGAIVTTNSGSGTIEPHWDSLSGSSYKRAGDFTSDFSPAEAHNGTWQLFGSANGAPQLGFIKTGGGVSSVEVHWDNLNGSVYTDAGDYTSGFSPENGQGSR